MKQVTILFLVIAMCGCGPRRQYVKNLELDNPHGFPRDAVCMDGGSRVLFFVTTSGAEEKLFLDRSIVLNRDGTGSETVDGHIYWGEAAFIRREHLDYTSPLADEIMDILTSYKPPKGYQTPSVLLDFLDKMKRERAKVNKTTEHVSVGPARPPLRQSHE